MIDEEELLYLEREMSQVHNARLDNLAIANVPRMLEKHFEEHGQVLFPRVWAMPNRYTFKMKPVEQLLMNEVGCECWLNWGDPMAGHNSPADLTNDIDPTAPTKYHMDALSWLKTCNDGTLEGCLFDPPYSAAMAGGKYANPPAWIKYIHACQDEIARIIKIGGKCISFGWSSNGLGMKRGFKLIRGLLIAHGGSHQHDTIVVVEVKQ